MSDSNDFYGWLLNEKKLQKASAKDVISRLKRVRSFMDWEKNIPEDKLLANLSHISSFRNLTETVRSQLRRAVRLFKEFESSTAA